MRAGGFAGVLRFRPTESGGVANWRALMSCLDLVVTVDTMPAHLAGALGRPVWTLLARAADWRWHGSARIVPGIPPCGCSGSRRRGIGIRW